MFTVNTARLFRDVSMCSAKLTLWQKGATAAASKIVVEDAKEILRRSQVLVPYKTGKLSRTGRVEDVRVGSVTTARVTYGSEDVAYAWVQHERLDFFHPNNRRAKYLEIPAYQVTRDIQRRVARAMLEGRLI
jgi:hypothetical protein